MNRQGLFERKKDYSLIQLALKTDPAATNTFLGSDLISSGSVSYDNYFTEVADVIGTDKSTFKFKSYADCDHNCKEAADQQMEEAGYSAGSASGAIQTKVNNTCQAKKSKPNLSEDAIGGSIYYGSIESK